MVAFLELVYDFFLCNAFFEEVDFVALSYLLSTFSLILISLLRSERDPKLCYCSISWVVLWRYICVKVVLFCVGGSIKPCPLFRFVTSLVWLSTPKELSLSASCCCSMGPSSSLITEETTSNFESPPKEEVFLVFGCKIFSLGSSGSVCLAPLIKARVVCPRPL